MLLTDMHVWFRQYAQQMGMQNTRAILPEQIDILLNTSISDIVNQIIKENIGITSDRVITDNSKIGNINALRTLYKVKEISINPGKEDSSFIFASFNSYSGLLVSNPKYKFPDYLFLVDFAIKYTTCNVGYGDDGGGYIWNNTFVSPYYPVRLIDDMYLADTLNDFVLKNRLRSPIITVHDNSYDLYIDKFEGVKNDKGDDKYTLPGNLLPYKLRMAYISKPAKVQYLQDLGQDNVECDLPDYLHVDIIKHAVDLYNIAISGNIHAAQQQIQNQQRENVRNNTSN